MSRNAVDLTGQRFGRLVAVAATPFRCLLGSVGWWLRCDCGGEAIRSVNVLRDSVRRGCVSGCDGCIAQESQACKKAGAVRGTCSWCGKPAQVDRVAFECSACNRAACRNGREADGRPIRIGKAAGTRRSHEAQRVNRERIAAGLEPIPPKQKRPKKGRGVAGFDQRMKERAS